VLIQIRGRNKTFIGA